MKTKKLDNPQNRKLRRLLQSILIGFVISVISVMASMRGYLRSFENNALDFLLAWQETQHVKGICLVIITENDYRGKSLKAVSPISRAYLAELIETILKGKPRVIGLDFDLTELGGKPDEKLQKVLATASDMGIPVVIAAPFLPAIESMDVHGLPVVLKKEGFAVLEKRDIPYVAKGIYLGHVCSPNDRDKVSRYLYPFTYVQGSQAVEMMPHFSLLQALLAAKPELTPQELESLYQDNRVSQDFTVRVGTYKGNGIWGSRRLELSHINTAYPINYTGSYESFASISSGELLERKEANSLFENKIVLVGGTFQSARDFLYTPKGSMHGVYLLANAVAMFTDNRLIRKLNHFWEFLMECSIGLAISFMFFSMATLRATLLSFVLVLFTAPIASVVAFSSSGCWLNFIPTALAVIIHGNTAYVEKYLHIKRKVRELESKIQELRKEKNHDETINEKPSVYPHQPRSPDSNSRGPEERTGGICDQPERQCVNKPEKS